MNESRLSRALAFFADTPKSAIRTTNRKELQTNNKSHKNMQHKLKILTTTRNYSSTFNYTVTTATATILWPFDQD